MYKLNKPNIYYQKTGDDEKQRLKYVLIFNLVLTMLDALNLIFLNRVTVSLTLGLSYGLVIHMGITFLIIANLKHKIIFLWMPNVCVILFRVFNTCYQMESVQRQCKLVGFLGDFFIVFVLLVQFSVCITMFFIKQLHIKEEDIYIGNQQDWIDKIRRKILGQKGKQFQIKSMGFDFDTEKIELFSKNITVQGNRQFLSDTEELILVFRDHFQESENVIVYQIDYDGLSDKQLLYCNNNLVNRSINQLKMVQNSVNKHFRKEIIQEIMEYLIFQNQLQEKQKQLSIVQVVEIDIQQ